MFSQFTKCFHRRNESDSATIKISWTKTIINLENGTILNRTPLDWLLLLIFYTIFFCGITSLWFLCYWSFEKTLTLEKPKWLLSQPGFSFEPATTFRENYLKIEYQEKSKEEIEKFVEHIDKALNKYGHVPKEYFQECQSYNKYGYNTRQPCFFLKINRIMGFKTEAIESITDLPYEAPQELYLYLRNLTKQDLKERIWISCESKPKLKFLYYPQRFFARSAVDYGFLVAPDSSHFYNASDFKRIVAVQIEMILPNIKHHIRCFLWAKNIVRDVKGRMGWGLVRFSFEIKK